MGNPLQNGGSGTVSVNVTPLGKTSVQEAGIAQVTMPDGTPVVVLGPMLFPRHDVGAVEAAKRYLSRLRDQMAADPTKPAPAVFILGGALDTEAFKNVANERDDVKDILNPKSNAVIDRILDEEDTMEDRFLALAHEGGEFIASFAEASGGHVYYLPLMAGTMGNDFELFRWVKKEKGFRDKKAAKHPKEAVVGPDIPSEYEEFLGLTDNPHVTVCTPGAAVELNGVWFTPGDYKRRSPVSAALVEVEHNAMSVVRSFDGKLGAGWWTTPKHTLGGPKRRYWQAHEVGNMFDLTQSGWLRNYDRRGKGFWVGRIVNGTLQGAPYTLLRGRNGVRSFVVDGEFFDEPTAGGQSRSFSVPLPQRHNVPSAKPAAVRKSTQTAARTSRSTRSTTRRTSK